MTTSKKDGFLAETQRKQRKQTNIKVYLGDLGVPLKGGLNRILAREKGLFRVIEKLRHRINATEH
jgi:hypothetical protein